MENNKVINIGPNGLISEENNRFLLSDSIFIDVQTYVEAGISLPITEDEFQGRLGIHKEDVAEFKDLISIYNAIYEECNYFKNTTYPMTVNLASDIVHYNTKVPTYYGDLLKIIDLLQSGKISEELGMKKVEAILNNLVNTAKVYSDNASTAKEKVTLFVDETKKNKNNLEPLNEKYKKEYESQGGYIQQYLKEIETCTNDIKYWNDKYKYDVTVAATTPTYAWVFPFGTIAAATVAGVYGKRATDDLNQVHKLQEELTKAEGELKKAINLTADLNLASNSIDEIIDKAEKAIPLLEKMQGIWGAISSDLENIITILNEDVRKAEIVIKELGVYEAIDAWKAVSEIADNYRLNAYISVRSEEEIKENPEEYDVTKTA